MFETAVEKLREFLVYWLALFGVADPFFVNAAMAIVAGIALLMAISIVFALVGAFFSALGGR